MSTLLVDDMENTTHWLTQLWSKWGHIDGLVQERRNSSVLAMEYIVFALTHQYNDLDLGKHWLK